MFSEIWAQAADSAPSQPASGGLMQMLPLIVGFIAIFYFLMIRPQQKEEKKKKAALSAIQKNDTVLTTSGFFGTVYSVKDNEVTIKFDDNTRIRCLKTAIQYVIKNDDDTTDKDNLMSKA